MKKVIQSKSLHRMLCTLLLLCAGIMTAAGTGTNYYFKVTADPEPTAGGKVYVSDVSTNNPDYVSGTSSKEGYVRRTGDKGTQIFHFYAQANDDYIFDHWATNIDGTGTVSNSISFSVELESDRKKENNPKVYNYYAIFKAQSGLIKVRVNPGDEKYGSVSINNPDNSVEDPNVTLTAYPDISKGVMFKGWVKVSDNGTPPDDPSVYDSKENPLNLVASDDTKGTYYAYFSDPATNVYIRLKNNSTGRFLCIYGDATAESHTRKFPSGDEPQDGFYFNGSLKMISASDALGNPNTVFLRSGHSESNAGTGVVDGVNLTANGVTYADLVGANTTNTKEMLTIENRNGNYRIYRNYEYDDEGRPIILPSYLCDEGEGVNDFAVMKTEVTGEEANWTLYSLDETTREGAFCANAKAEYTKDSKYYTTMYTDFPYQLLDGVNAYYLEYKEEYEHITDRVIFPQVEAKNGVTIVPANTAVILECKDVQKGTQNRLLPLLPDEEGGTTDQFVTEVDNYLKGYVYLNGHDRSDRKNDKKRMYVLSSKNGILGFYHSKAEYMTPNKAYLLIPDVSDAVAEEYAKKVTFSFGEPDEGSENQETNGIELSELIVDENDNTPVYNLNGTKVAEGKAAEKMLRPGVYVKKGKKFVVK